MDQPNCIEASHESQPVCVADAQGDWQQLTAKDAMQYGVVSIDRKEPVHKAVSLLLAKDISGLPVTDRGRLCGMLSERDLLRLVTRTEYLPGCVGDYMTQNIVSFDVDDPLPVVCKQLVENAFRRVPILLHQQTLAGVITRADLIRVCMDRFRPLTEIPRLESDKELLAEDVMSCGLLTLPPEAPLYEAMAIISRQHVTGLPIVDGAMRLLGIITEKDVLNYCIHPFPAETTVAAFMTTNVVAFDRKTSLDLVCECLIQKDFHRVPILDQGRLVGVISRSDILKSRVAVFKR
ncbi:MAG: CBS domain-containing protein [Phycisphaerales bacterium]